MNRFDEPLHRFALPSCSEGGAAPVEHPFLNSLGFPASFLDEADVKGVLFRAVFRAACWHTARSSWARGPKCANVPCTNDILMSFYLFA